MYAIAVLRYRRSLDEVLTVLDAHRAYLRELHQKGILLVSGPFEPRTGAALVLRVSDAASAAEELDAIREKDPFVRQGMAQYEIQVWDPVIGREDLDRIGAGDRPA
jgi:uncharacterized protein YciI